jgi:hypothetical protein
MSQPKGSQLLEITTVSVLCLWLKADGSEAGVCILVSAPLLTQGLSKSQVPSFMTCSKGGARTHDF